MPTIRELLTVLDGDSWRSSNPFSDEISTACSVLLNPYARNDERIEVIRGWLRKFQPCIFGQIAAKTNKLYISIIDDDLLAEGDEAVQEQLLLDKRTWKQWSLEGEGRHGFLAVVLSPKLHHAAPNRALQRLAEQIKSLFISETIGDVAGNNVSSEWIYLKNPANGEIRKFRVILDFFAAPGDQRWWHDHRFPGGIAFSLNSLGHLVRAKEWYEKLEAPQAWATKMAMTTIANAHEDAVCGRATHLLDIKGATPLKSSPCPFSDTGKLPEILRGKDWTTYSGWLHTDHSIRKEFFDQQFLPNREKGEYLLDFSYIAGSGSIENSELMDGVRVAIDEVYAECGRPEDWRFVEPIKKSFESRPIEEDRKIREVLSICQNWLAEES